MDHEETACPELLRRIAIALVVTGCGPWEILVVGDGLEAVVRSSRIENLRVISSPVRCGPGTARQRGSLAARGAIVGWINGDGAYTPQDLVWLIKNLRSLEPAPATTGACPRSAMRSSGS